MPVGFPIFFNEDECASFVLFSFSTFAEQPIRVKMERLSVLFTCWIWKRKENKDRKWKMISQSQIPCSLSNLQFPPTVWCEPIVGFFWLFHPLTGEIKEEKVFFYFYGIKKEKVGERWKEKVFFTSILLGVFFFFCSFSLLGVETKLGKKNP